MFPDTAAVDHRTPAAGAGNDPVVEAVADVVDDGRIRNDGSRIRRRTAPVRILRVPLSVAFAQLQPDGAEVKALLPLPTTAIWLVTTPSPCHHWKDVRSSRT